MNIIEVEKHGTMSRNHERLRNTASRQAFTLVELLIVCAIILLLAVLTLFAVNKANTATKVTKTRATIQKLDVALRQIFESYEDQFVAIKRRVARQYPDPDFSEEDRQKIAAHFIRDLMRMEMPQSWGEVNAGPLGMKSGGYSVDASPLLEFYQRESGKTTSRAALLFLMIQNLNPEALEAFHGSEVVRNKDGFLEFVDAWGNPIQFLRWAPAFPDSDLQQNVLKMAGYVPTANQADNRSWWLAMNPELLEAMKDASQIHPDPMDERIPELLDDPKHTELVGWFLYPLIYSAGPDGKYGIEDGIDDSGGTGTAVLDEDGVLDPYAFPFGMPDGTKSHFDNIHNHQWYRSF